MDRVLLYSELKVKKIQNWFTFQIAKLMNKMNPYHAELLQDEIKSCFRIIRHCSFMFKSLSHV